MSTGRQDDIGDIYDQVRTLYLLFLFVLYLFSKIIPQSKAEKEEEGLKISIKEFLKRSFHLFMQKH